jgi:tRNA threonylcarbamoyl adenosine modification protein YeaZ
MTKTTLLINTTGPEARIAFTRGGQFLCERQWPADRELSRRLLEEIDLLLTEAGLEKADIGRVAVHCGPGHFGSTRTGVVVASTLAYALSAELAEVARKSWEENVKEAESVAAVEAVEVAYG